MDNQQATKNWFIGVLEGEGCFIKRQPRNLNHNPIVEVRISNTERDVIDFCAKFLSNNKIYTYTLTSAPGRHKPVHELYISTLKKCQALYELIKDDIDCRRNELERILGASTTTRETSLSVDWLAGIFEAEGCFTISTRTKNIVSHNPEIILENTNFVMINKIAKNLYNLGLSWYIQDRHFENKNWKDTQIIKISGFKRANRFLIAMKDRWLGSKTKRKVELLTKFCNSRLSKEEKAKYTDTEHELAREIKMKI